MIRPRPSVQFSPFSQLMEGEGKIAAMIKMLRLLFFVFVSAFSSPAQWPFFTSSRQARHCTSDNNLDSNKEDGSSSSDDRRQQEGVPSPPQDENNATSTPKRLHRSKWSHETLRRGDDKFSEEKKTFEPEPSVDSPAEEDEDSSSTDTANEEQTNEDPSPASMTHGMAHPFSPNPYDHPSSSTLPSMAVDAKDSSHDAAAASVATFRPRPSVKFSPNSQLALYDKTECANSSWSTEDDKVRYKRKLSRDARRMGRILTTQSPQDVARDYNNIYRCVGIEHLLSLDKMRRYLKHRRDHAERVMGAQRNGEELDRISRESSKHARRRAQKLAAGYWGMGMLDA